VSGRSIAKASDSEAVYIEYTNRRAWTREEERQLAALYADGFTPARLSRILCRTVGAINSKLDYMLVERKTKYRAWTAPELRRALKMRADGAGFSAIARELGRSPTSVRHAIIAAQGVAA
jgi:DNA-binding CsgD family transcriptional regulator